MTLRRPILFILFLLITSASGFAQADTTDTVVLLPPDTNTVLLPADTTVRRDSIPTPKRVEAPPILSFDTAVFAGHPFYRIDAPVKLISARRAAGGKEIFFYILLGLFLFFAFVKNAFSRYLNDLFKIFFRTTIKQRQVKEQLMEAPLPSLLLNILFFLIGALFLSIVLERYGLGDNFNFWLLLLYCALGLAAIYLVKFITLKLCGWMFGVAGATDSYIFIVFTTNKILGITLLPLTVLLVFSSGHFNEVVLTLSLLLVAVIFFYRFILSYISIHRQVKISFFHFLLYLCAFEVAPLLLINKLLFDFLR
ncbi:MAG TPA: DUF4271 domain-containing protein [Flavisolibacter sp.]|nr:DUF4271 domain-containing protein [Flavisolibacter sp.]